MRKKLSRVEEENESLVMQLKKMAMKKGRRATPDTSIDKDEGISDDMDDLSLSELRLQLELNEQVQADAIFSPSTTMQMTCYLSISRKLLCCAAK